MVAVLAALAILGAACGGPIPAPVTKKTPRKVSGSLHTRGSRIVRIITRGPSGSATPSSGQGLFGPAGAPLRLLGINLQGMQSSNDQGSDRPDRCGRDWELPPSDAPRNIASWGFNAVRLPIAWANLEPRPPTRDAGGNLVHHWGQEYLNALDGLIASLSSHNIAIVLDPAQYHWSSAFKESGLSGARVDCEGYGMPAWLNPNAANETIQGAKCDFIANRPEQGVPETPWEGLSAVWTMLGKRYGGNPAVIAADTFNEPFFHPGACSGPDFQGFYRTIGTAIRRVAPHWLLIFEYYPPAVSSFGITSPPPFVDAIYSIHVYAPDWPGAKRLLDPAWNQARQWGMPLFVGEFDAFGEARDRPSPNWVADTEVMVRYMKDRGISWTFFGYAGGLSIIDQDGSPKAELLSVLQSGF